MGDTNIDLARRWVEGHLRWPKLEKVIKGKKLELVTLDRLQNREAKKQFESVTIKDLGKKYYGIPTEEVVKIFEVIKDIGGSSSSSSTPLNYDSFSDAELDELEVTYEPYDEEELDRLMSEYDSSSGTEQSLSASYNSESESEQNLSTSYNSESESEHMESDNYTSASYDSDSD